MCAAALVLCLLLPRAQAHDDGASTSTVEVSDHNVRWQLDVGLGPLAQILGLTPAQQQEPGLGASAVRARMTAYLARVVTVSAAGQPLSAEPHELVVTYEGPPGTPGATRIVQTILFRSPSPIGALELRLSPFAELGNEHRALVQVAWGGHHRQFARVGPTAIQLDAADMPATAWSSIREFLPWGVHHILLGYDHLAFLLALLLGATRFRQLLIIVTAFTVAHSLTLVLSAASIITVPPRIAEALIAASVAYVAAENLGWWRSHERRRWIIAFVFGLVHGLGFANELRQRLAGSGDSWLLPVLSFNVGVELGQLAVIALLFPLLVRLRKGRTASDSAARQRRLLRMGSVPLLILGLFWLVARLAG